MASKAVEKVVAGNVPDLAPTPATTVGFEDIAPPSLYIAQRTSAAVDLDVVSYGDLFIAQGSDDVEPTVMWKSGSSDEGVLFYPLHMFKTWTFSDGNNLQSWAWGNGVPPQEALEVVEADDNKHPLFRTYNYVTFIPEYDEEMPVYFRLNSKSQRPAVNKINLVSTRDGQPWLVHAFRVTTDKREKGANKWAVPIVTEAVATQEHVDKAIELYSKVLPGLQARQAAADAVAAAPAI